VKRALVLACALLVVAAAPSAWASGACGSHPWCNRNLLPDARAGLLLAAMTSSEKISLLAGDNLNGVVGGENLHTGTGDGVARLGIPSVNYTDGPVGPRQGPVTALPVPMALGATWDPGLARVYGSVVGNEARLKGNDAVFGPTVDIVRTPRAGRTYEDYGEDPLLSSDIAVAWIRGAQSQGVMATIKHFALNNQEGYSPLAQQSAPGQLLGPAPTEGSRLLVNARVSERALHEIYLPMFEAAVRRGRVALVMCAYNRVNGTYACENHELLTDILRRQWGFQGYVMADYGAVHHAGTSLAAGLDFEPWPGVLYGPAQVNLALASGQATMAEVNQHVRRILRTMFAFGLFDRAPYTNVDTTIAHGAHARDAQRIEESAITLLRNRGSILPLRASRLRQVAIIGADANRFVTGGGSGNITPYKFVSALAGITARLGPRVRVTYDDGSNVARAAADARAADTAIVFAGDYDTEGVDRNCLTLECPQQGDQDGLIRSVSAAQRRTVVVLETGGPVLTPWRAQVPGLLEAWYPGGMAGPAIARVLFGDVDPGGRLPATFPQSETQLPTAGDPQAYPGVNEQVTYKEGLLVGYRWYDAKHLTPAYPFGFGLSYTSFSIDRLRVSGVRRFPLSARVSFRVRNRGRRAGTAVPELYLKVPVAGEPPRRLGAFTRVTLGAGRSRTVTVMLDPASFAVWNVAARAWDVRPGCYGFELGQSSREIDRRATVSLRGARCRGAAARLP
jgi:beta-glucosidase